MPYSIGLLSRRGIKHVKAVPSHALTNNEGTDPMSGLRANMTTEEVNAYFHARKPNQLRYERRDMLLTMADYDMQQRLAIGAESLCAMREAI
jgi:hypothetical protein